MYQETIKQWVKLCTSYTQLHIAEFTKDILVKKKSFVLFCNKIIQYFKFIHKVQVLHYWK